MRRPAGIISARNNYKRRQAVRDAWGDASQVRSVSSRPLTVCSARSNSLYADCSAPQLQFLCKLLCGQTRF